jgi:hypothetical protein
MLKIWCLVLACFFGLSACTSNSVRRVDGMGADAKVGAGKSVVVLDADVELSELLASGLLQIRADWTTNARKLVMESLSAELKLRGASVISPAEIKDVGVAEHAKQLELLAQVVSFSALSVQLAPGGGLPTKRGRFDWNIGPNAKILQAAYGADYALITLVQDSYATAGRKALTVLGILSGGVVGVNSGGFGGQRIGFTSLVDLRTGKLIWINLMSSSVGDLRQADGARAVVKSLLTGLPL